MNKLVPLSGVAAVVAILVGFAITGDTPDANASATEVASFWTKHDSDGQFSGALVALGSVLFLIFSGTVAGVLRRAQNETGGASTLAYGGGILFVVGMAIFASLVFTLGDAGPDIDPSAAQTLNALNEDLFFPVAAGAVAFLLGAGIGILKTGVLPKALGWLAIVGVVIGLTPVGFFSMAILALFTLISSVILAMRAETA
jgi:hypothetical protein